MKYVIGRGKWLESVAIGLVGSVATFVSIFIIVPTMIICTIGIFVLGIAGFLKREE